MNESTQLPPGEPAAGPWTTVPLPALVDLVRAAAGQPTGRPAIVAVDGRGASGKSTLAARLQEQVPASVVIHTDDLAWHEPYFAWGHLLQSVLRPVRSGEAVSFQPPAWKQRGRGGAIEVPAGLDLVIVEGTGASQREHADLVDATIWVQSDLVEAERRGIARDVEQGVNGDLEQATAFWREWMAEELPFLRRQEPWQRACVVVDGTPSSGLRSGRVAVAAPPAAPTPPTSSGW